MSERRRKARQHLASSGESATRESADAPTEPRNAIDRAKTHLQEAVQALSKAVAVAEAAAGTDAVLLRLVVQQQSQSLTLAGQMLNVANVMSSQPSSDTATMDPASTCSKGSHNSASMSSQGLAPQKAPAAEVESAATILDCKLLPPPPKLERHSTELDLSPELRASLVDRINGYLVRTEPRAHGAAAARRPMCRCSELLRCGGGHLRVWRTRASVAALHGMRRLDRLMPVFHPEGVRARAFGALFLLTAIYVSVCVPMEVCPPSRCGKRGRPTRWVGGVPWDG